MKLKRIYEDFSVNKETFDFSNYSAKSKYYDNSNKLVKDENGCVAIEEFVELKPKMYAFFVDNNQLKKVKGLNKNVVAIISHNEHKDVLLNKKCVRHSMNRIESKDHQIGKYEINKISLSCFDEKTYT